MAYLGRKSKSPPKCLSFSSLTFEVPQTLSAYVGGGRFVYMFIGSSCGGAEGAYPVSFGTHHPAPDDGANVPKYSCKGIVPMVKGIFTTKSNAIPEGIT